MAVISQPFFKTYFELNATPAPKLRIQDITDYASNSIPLSGVKGVITAIDPSGTIFYNNTNYLSPDVNRQASDFSSTTIFLPLDASGKVVLGSYTIIYSVQINDGSNPIYIVTASNIYNNCYVKPTVSISQTVDCLSPLFTSQDETDYTVNGIEPAYTTVHTLYFPVGSALYGSPISNSLPTLTTSTFFEGTQTTTIATYADYTFADGLIVTDTITGQKEIDVDCSFACNIYCCIKSLYNRKENARGVNNVQFAKYNAELDEVASIVGLIDLAIKCGKQDDVSGYLNKIKQITSCSDDCSCSDGEPSQVTGLAGSGINVVVQSGGSPVNVTSSTVGNTTTYTISLSSIFVNKVNNSYNTVVAAGTNVTVSSNTVGDVTTYTVNATTPPVQNRTEFTALIEYSTLNGVVITSSDFLTTGSNFQNGTVSSVGTVNTATWLASLNYFKVSGFQLVPNNDYKVTVESVVLNIDSTAVRTASSMYLSRRFYDIEVLNQAQTPGEFYFRFVEDELPVTNQAIIQTAFPRSTSPGVYVGSGIATILVNIKISE